MTQNELIESLKEQIENLMDINLKLVNDMKDQQKTMVALISINEQLIAA